MDVNGLLAALAATGEKLNAAEVAMAQLSAENQQLRAELAAAAPDVSEKQPGPAPGAGAAAAAEPPSAL